MLVHITEQAKQKKAVYWQTLHRLSRLGKDMVVNSDLFIHLSVLSTFY